jgi:hypothetical protein
MELTDLDQWDITVPHEVDQLVGWKTYVLVYCAGEKGNILEAITSISQRILCPVTQNMVKRVNIYIQQNGEHSQHIL